MLKAIHPFQGGYLYQLDTHPETIKFINEVSHNENFRGIIIGPIFYQENDLKILNQLRSVETLMIDSDNITDFSAVYDLSKLSTLIISEKNKEKIDFNRIESLKILHCDKRNLQPNFSINNLHTLKISNLNSDKIFNTKNESLEKLVLTNYKPKSLDLNAFNLENLTSLTLISSSIKSLDGLGRSKKLKDLILNRCKKLESISSILLLKQLYEISIYACPQISDLYLLNKHPSIVIKTLNGLPLKSNDISNPIRAYEDLDKINPIHAWKTRMKNGDDTFSEKAIYAAEEILNTFIQEIKDCKITSKLQAQNALDKVLNDLKIISNDKSDFGSFIETQELEELASFIITVLSIDFNDYEFNVVEQIEDW